MNTGMIGLGAMGANMARNIAKAGMLTSVWNRTPANAEKLAAELHVSKSDSAAQLAAKVDVVLICVSADADVLAIVTAISKSIKPATVVVDMSTVSSATAQLAAKKLAEKQALFLDAPVSGGVEGAKNGTLAMMVGGDASVLEQVKPVLEAMSSRLIHMGGHGAGQATKAVNQLMAAGINQAVTEALAFAQAQGLPMQEVIEIISGGAAGNWFLEHRGAAMCQGTFSPGFKLALHYKDLKICRAMAGNTGVSTTLLDMTLNDYEDLLQQGYGDEDISALYRKKRQTIEVDFFNEGC